MSGIQQTLLGGSPAGYQIERSLRFNSADSAYLNRTPASAGNRRTWTWSGWVKRSAITANSPLFSVSQDSSNFTIVRFGPGTTDKLEIYTIRSSTDYSEETNALFRDVSAWYHIVFSVDTTQATAANRIRIYVNGVQQTTTQFYGQIPQNEDTFVNTTNAHNIGRNTDTTTQHFNGYLTEVNFIDGQALTPSDFGETDSATGVWKPKKFSGTYGTNGFYLNFSDNSNTTAATLGKDSSGNGNNWTPNNFSVTAGAGNDSLVDTPTSYGTDTGVGGEVRGNYCTMNPLDSATSASNPTNGNLDWSSAATNANYFPSRGTLGMSSGKWYWEVTCGTSSGGFQIGIAGQAVNFANNAGQQLYNCSDGYAYLSSAVKGNNGSTSSYGATYTTNDVIGIALDMDAGTLVFYKNGVSQGTAYSSLSGTFFAAISDNSGSNNSAATFNFGQRPFAYTAPSGFKALCTQNLPTPTIGATSTTQANRYFDIQLYTGTGSSRSVTGYNFQPEFVWIKGRSGATDHGLYDAVRGVQNQLESNTTTAETTETTGLTAFNSDGFTVGSLAQLNTNTATYVAWAWDAAGSNSTNTSGTITSTVRASTTAGFSIVTYTASGSTFTVGHGLGVAPSMVLHKQRNNGVNDWLVYHTSLGTNSYLRLNTTAASSTLSGLWTTSSTTFGCNSAGTNPTLSGDHVFYCFAAVAGYSAFGSYTGNGSTDGPFVYTGFKPRYLLVKNASNGTADAAWIVIDSARSDYNQAILYLVPNTSGAEASSTGVATDFLSNGFKIRNTSTAMNANTNTIIYAAFAESPAKYSLAR